MTRMIRFVLALALILAAIPAQAQNKGFGWLVESDRGKAYVYGSLHFGMPEMYPLPGSVQQAFADSDVLVVELDPEADPQGMQQALFERGVYPHGETLEDNLSDLAKEAFAKAGIDYRTYNIMRPWMALLTVQVTELMRLGYQPDMGLDVHFLHLARERSMDVAELETPEEQFDMLAGIMDKHEDIYICWALAELKAIPQQIDRLTRAWMKGDDLELDRAVSGWAFLRILFKDLYDGVYYERNERMADALWEMMAGPKVPFMVVGAGHVVGERGIIALLEARGCRVTRL